MGLHKFAYGCNFTDQINGLHVLCKCPKRTFGHHMVFDYEKEERERETFKIEKKNCILLQEFLFKMNSSTNFEIWSHLLKFLVFALLLRLIVNNKT